MLLSDVLSLYPSLARKFENIDANVRGNLTFADVKKQLEWAFNEYEMKRTIHRLHCLVTFLLEKKIAVVEKLSPDEKQALIVLVLLDGCKNSPASIDAFQKRGYAALKDAVPSFFRMLEKAPEIFSIYNVLSDGAKLAIKTKFFYLHLRHLQLGEVPAASVPQRTLQRSRVLMDAFWYLNACGFNIEKNYALGESTSETFDRPFEDKFYALLAALDGGVLINYYLANSVFDGRENLKQSFNPMEQEFICRLEKMLAFITLDNNFEYQKFIYNQSTLIKSVAALETKIFSECSIEAITFLPAVLKNLKEKIMQGKTEEEVLIVFLELQRQLYLSIPNFIAALGDNRTIPLFGLSSQQDAMLAKFASSPDRTAFHFEASVGNFINIQLADEPVPQLTIKAASINPC